MNERIRELFEAVKQDPSNPVAIQDLEAAFHDAEDWPGLLDLYLFLADHAQNGVSKSEFFRQAALVAEVQLDDAVRAVEFLHESLGGDESSIVSTLGEMRRLLLGLQDWDNYLEVSQNEVELLDDPEGISALLLEMGQVLETHLGDLENAQECYQTAFNQDQECVQALWASRRIYRQQQSWPEVASLLEMELERGADDNQTIEILREMGELYLREMDRTEDAAACFQRILELDPSHGIAQAALAELGLSSAGTDGETMLGVPTPIEEEDAAGALDQRPTLVHIPTGMDSAEGDDEDEILEDVAVIEETVAPEDRETEVSLEAYDDAGPPTPTLGDEEATPTVGDGDDDSEVGSLEDALDSLICMETNS